MKKTLITILITTVVTAVVVMAIFEIQAQMNQPDPDELEVIDSKILEEKRNILIHLPYNYDPQKTYPVMYVLDGSSQGFRMAGITELFSRASLVEEMIIVGIPNTDRNRDLTPHYILQDTDGEIYGQGDKFLDFIVEEVIPLVEGKYPANSQRLLSGHSRGGLFVYYAYLEQPDVFDAVFSFSPAFWRDDLIIIDKAKEFYASNQDDRPFIFMSLGTEENDKMKHAYQKMIELLDANKVNNIYHTFTPLASHGNNLYYSTPMALKKYAENLQQ